MRMCYIDIAQINIRDKIIMKDRIELSSQKLKREKKIKRTIKIILIVFLLLLLILYFVVGIIYSSGNFSITLDKNLYFEKGIIIYDDPDYKVFRAELLAKPPDTFDNISYKWLPNDINDYDGSHNGDNYLAYTFYVENQGSAVSDYWSEIVIDDVIKNVDEAVRVRVYKDGVPTTYAKLSSNGNPEEDTIPFADDKLIARDHVEAFKPGDIIKYTIVLWVEGSDLDCTDNIIGGEFKVYMVFNSEFVEK